MSTLRALLEAWTEGVQSGPWLPQPRWPHPAIVLDNVAGDSLFVDPADAATLVNALPALLDVVDAAAAYSPERDHDWRCEYRTAKVGWKQGDPPVIRCECGHDELRAALDRLSALEEP